MPIRTSGLGCFSRIVCGGSGHFKIDKGFSRLRAVRTCSTATPGGAIDTGEHRGRVGEAEFVAEFKRYLRVAIGSCDEVKLWLEMSKDEGYASSEAINALMDRVNRIGAMLASLWKHWRNGE
ncbi:MAG TPA: four helix bundle protein [Candidatus Acidoferrales bacterium]|nr:four helix bundle protein [Candidatus Acidoferrales bacterium]